MSIPEAFRRDPERCIAPGVHRVLPSMKCPLTKELFVDPVMASDGYTYERAAILERIRLNHKTSPKDPQHQLGDHVQPHLIIRALVESFLGELFRMLDTNKLTVQAKFAEGRFKTAYHGTYENKPVTLTEIKGPRGTAVLPAFEEARTLGRLILHPHVLCYIGLCAHNDHPGRPRRMFLVTEFARFGSLLNFLYGVIGPGQQRVVQALSLRHKVTMMVQICAGMAHLARCGEVHRDLAARNVLVLVFDDQKDPLEGGLHLTIADFGHVVQLYGKSCVNVGPSASIPQRAIDVHSSPELVNQGLTACSADDVWAFAVTCIEILTIDRLPASATMDEVTAYQNSEYLKGITVGRGPPCPDKCPGPLWTILNTCFTGRRDRAKFNTLEPLLTQYLTTLRP